MPGRWTLGSIRSALSWLYAWESRSPRHLLLRRCLCLRTPRWRQLPCVPRACRWTRCCSMPTLPRILHLPHRLVREHPAGTSGRSRTHSRDCRGCRNRDLRSRAGARACHLEDLVREMLLLFLCPFRIVSLDQGTQTTCGRPCRRRCTFRRRASAEMLHWDRLFLFLCPCLETRLCLCLCSCRPATERRRWPRRTSSRTRRTSTSRQAPSRAGSARSRGSGSRRALARRCSSEGRSLFPSACTPG